MNEEQRQEIKDFYDMLKTKITMLCELNIQINKYNNILENFNEDLSLPAEDYLNRLWTLEDERENTKDFLVGIIEFISKSEVLMPNDIKLGSYSLKEYFYNLYKVNFTDDKKSTLSRYRYKSNEVD